MDSERQQERLHIPVNSKSNIEGEKGHGKLRSDEARGMRRKISVERVSRELIFVLVPGGIFCMIFPE